MPPSGFNLEQSGKIIEYLDSISDSLRQEGLQKGLSPIEALKNEINNIENIVESEFFNPLSKFLLLMTKEFYVELGEKNPDSYSDFINIKKVVLERIRKDILEIHVPEVV